MGLKKHYPIKLVVGGRENFLSERFQTEEGQRKTFQKVLQNAYKSHQKGAEIRALCMCPGREEKPLSLKRHIDNNSYFFAKFPGTGPRHARDCRFFSPDPSKSGLRCYAPDTIEFNESGVIKVRTDFSLTSRLAVGDKERVFKEDLSGKRRERVKNVSLKGLTHLLFEEADLNIWHPKMEGKRTYDRVPFWLKKASHQIKVGKVLFSDMFVCGVYKSDKRSIKSNLSILEGLAHSERRVVVSGVLPDFSMEKHKDLIDGEGWYLPLKLFSGVPFLKLSKRMSANLFSNFDYERESWLKGGRVLVTVVGVPRKDNRGFFMWVDDVYLMHVSERWIPLFSDGDEKKEKKLVEAGLSFERVLPYDYRGDLPSFTLLG